MGGETGRIGDLFRRFSVLSDAQLQRCLEHQGRLKEKGIHARLGQIAVDLGYLTPEQVRRLMAHDGAAMLRCPACDRRFTVKPYQSNRRYKCGACKNYLEFSVDDNLASEAMAPVAEAAPAAPQPAVFAPPASQKKGEPLVGRVLGNYRLLSLLGKGGMGVVYLAEHTELRRKAAVKILAEEFSRIPDIVKRFKREATAGGRMEHPNIAEVYDMGQQDGLVFIVSEYVEGTGLENLLLKEKRLAPERAAALMKDVLAGLQHAHEHGIAHRDIKPGNVLLTKEERAKVIDFGLAQDAEAQTVLTLTGKIMGTPSYMSPEQAKGERGSPLSDLYACGVLLFVMLTGRKPFEGKGLLETLEKHVKEPPPPITERHPEVPKALEKVVHRLMAKEPQKRYGSAAASIQALDAALGKGPPVEEPAAAGAGGARWIFWGAAAAGGALAAAAAYLLLR